MTPNERLITGFYEAFRNKDYKVMQGCYSDSAVFDDEVFIGLNAEEVRAMWEMFCVKGKGMQLEFSKVQADERHGSAEWTASYVFSKTNRKVVNHIKAHFTFSNGKIIRHKDQFDFYSWARQAFGVTGILLGWTPFLKSRVRQEGLKNLRHYMQRRKSNTGL
jgi:ketosteroid isomerase-like protein